MLEKLEDAFNLEIDWETRYDYLDNLARKELERAPVGEVYKSVDFARRILGEGRLEHMQALINILGKLAKHREHFTHYGFVVRGQTKKSYGKQIRPYLWKNPKTVYSGGSTTLVRADKPIPQERMGVRLQKRIDDLERRLEALENKVGSPHDTADKD